MVAQDWKTEAISLTEEGTVDAEIARGLTQIHPAVRLQAGSPTVTL
jgi:hypothetical protein